MIRWDKLLNTLWEDMIIKKARSLNQKMFATPLGWMARYAAGLKVDGIMGNGLGFRNVIIQPHVSPSQMQFVSFAYDSPVDKYKSHWQVNGEGVVYDLTIPPNGSATLRQPLLGKSLVSVSELGKEIWKDGKTIGTMAGGKDGHIEQEEFVISLGSGTYSFQVKTK
jgi:alpha-L-rhamnosidase